MYTAEQLAQMRKVDIAAVDRATLIDDDTISIDTEASHADSAAQYMAQVKNPYAFRVGDVAVKVSYAEGGPLLEDALVNYLSAVRNKL